MPRLVIMEGTQKLMDEYVIPDHLNDEHAAVQLLERLAWAVEDGEQRANRRPHRRKPRQTAGYLGVDGS